jgi:hypothetical protein
MIFLFKYVSTSPFCAILFKLERIAEYFNIIFVGAFMIQYTMHILGEVECGLLRTDVLHYRHIGGCKCVRVYFRMYVYMINAYNLVHVCMYAYMYYVSMYVCMYWYACNSRTSNLYIMY